MNTTHRIRMIVAVAVALTIAVAGIASASPPVQPPNETSIITTTVTIECHGTVTEVEDLDAAYSFIPDGLVGEANGSWMDALAQQERVAQVQYSENLKAVDGFTQFTKDFKWDGETGPNLAVDKRIAYVEDETSAISWVDNTENVAMTIVTEGDANRVGEDVAALCVWAQDVCIPPTNELVAAGSQLYMVDLVSATTKTSVSTTESPRLAHRITGTGIPGYGAYVDTVLGPEGTLDGPYGVGTISAGMKVSSQEGRGCDYDNNGTEYYPQAGQLTYDEMTTAKGFWDFDKSMTYESQIADVNIPRSWRVFNLPV
ncbi:MAG: hypothetical protein ACNYVW_00675 [Methanosarcinales archaeon]